MPVMRQLLALSVTPEYVLFQNSEIPRQRFHQILGENQIRRFDHSRSSP
ncbi:MAG: hypothetical protein ACI9OD_001018 [Limisphaerales bacterium]|jgi:hypothetical protein